MEMKHKDTKSTKTNKQKEKISVQPAVGGGCLPAGSFVRLCALRGESSQLSISA
jgi:hypothetical protein